ncbi:MAG: heavy metal translocating P-type ATPase [Clostridia bacterium]
MNHLKTYKDHYLTVVCGFFVIASWFGWFKELVEFDVAIIAAVLGGYPIIKNALIAFIKGRDMKVGFLVSIALIAALAIGEYFAAGEVVFIMMLGELLENWTVAKSRNAVAKLRKLIPDTATVKIKDNYISKPLEKIAIGDVVFVRPGESIPADGIVVNGSSSVDQSAITGESVPGEKEVGDEVYTSTMNQNGSLEIRVSKASEDTLISKIIHLVQQAETSKSPIVRITDKWANWLVPSSLTFAVLTYLMTGDIIRIVKKAKPEKIPLFEVSEFSYHRGLGVEGRINLDKVYVGNLSFIRQTSGNKSFDLPELEAADNSYIYFKDEIIGIIQVSDAIRENADQTVGKLHQYVKQILLLTGDNKAIAENIAS